MKNKHIIAIALLILPIIALGQLNQESNQISIEKSKFEIEKLQLEIMQLQNVNRSSSFAPYISIVGGIVACGTLIWTILAGLRTFSNRTIEQKNVRISKSLEALSSESMPTRIGAVRSLKINVDEVVNELLTMIEIEESPTVLQAIVDTLSSCGKNSVQLIINANSITFSRRAWVMGRMSANGTEIKNVYGVAGLTTESGSILLKRYKSYYQQGKKSYSFNSVLTAIGDDSELNKIMRNYSAIAEVTGIILSQIIRDHKIIKNKNIEVDLSRTNLYGGCVKRSNFNYSFIGDAIMRHTVFISNKFRKTDFSNSDLYDTKIDNCLMEKCLLINAHFRSSTIIRSCYKDCDLTSAIFSGSDLKQNVYNNCKANKIQLRGCGIYSSQFCDCLLGGSHMQGANINRSRFINTKLHSVNLHGATIIKSFFEGVEIYGAILSGTKFISVVANNVKFNGIDLTSTIFVNCSFNNCDFSGANLDRVDFSTSKMKDSKFIKCKNYEHAIFKMA